MGAIKLIVCLALCGVTYCAATDSCTENEYQKCMGSAPFDPSPMQRMVPLTDAELTNYCNISVPQIDCIYKYETSCENRTDMLQHYKLYQNILGLMCDTQNPFRQKYIDNARCLSKVLALMGDRCPMESIPDGASRKERCKKLNSAINCGENLARRKCGNDARVVFAELYRSTYEFFVLRPSKCI